MTYMILFDEDGKRATTYPVDKTMSDKQKESLIDNGFIETSEEDWEYYVGYHGTGDNGTGYVRDKETGKPVSAPVYIPSKEVLANRLFDECQADLREIDGQIINAIVIKDNEIIEELRLDRDERIAEYEAALEELEKEGEDDGSR